MLMTEKADYVNTGKKEKSDNREHEVKVQDMS